MRRTTDIFRFVHRSERGSVLVIVTMMLVVILGAVGFVVDIGRVYLLKNELQVAADMGVSAAIRQVILPSSKNPKATITINEGRALQIAERYVKKNVDKKLIKDDSLEINIKINNKAKRKKITVYVAAVSRPLPFVGLLTASLRKGRRIIAKSAADLTEARQ